MLNYLDYIKAYRLEKEKKWEQAFALYKKNANNEKFVSANLAYRLGFVAEKLKNWKEAQLWLARAVSQKPERAQWCYRLAWAMENNKKYAEAAQNYEKICRLMPQNAKWLFRWGRVLELDAHYPQAAEIYAQAVALEPSNTGVVFRWGRALEQAACYAEAAQAYAKAVAQEPGNTEFLFRLGRAQEQGAHYTEAAAAYGRCVELEPVNTEFLFRHGRALEQEGSHELAADVYRQVLELEPKNAACHFHLGEVLCGLQQWDQALESYSKAVALRPKISPWLYQWAQLLEQQGKFAEAAKAYRQALAQEPANVQWLCQLARVLEISDKYPDAVKAYHKALALQPDPALELYVASLDLYVAGLALEAAKKYADAQSLYQQALAKEPQRAAWHYHLGRTLYLGGRAPEAEEPLRQAMALELDNAKYVHELALAIRKQNRTWQEVEVLQQALALEPVHAQWWFELGDAQDKMNCFAEAARAFQDANQRKPGNAMWHFREGYAWERAGKTRQAQIAYAMARTADKELKANEFGIGVFHQKRGFWPQAAEAYEREAKANPFNAELQYRLGQAHDRCYRWEQAAVCYRQALVSDPHKPDWHYRLGFVLERQGLWQQAAEAYEYAATTRAMHTPYWFYRLGYVLMEAGRQEEACAAFLYTRKQAELDANPDEQQASMPEAHAALSRDYLDRFLRENLCAVHAQGLALYSRDQVAAFYKLGNQAERLQMWEEAAQAYQAAAERSENHNSLLYYRIGYVLVMLGQYEEACAAFKQTRILQRPHGVSEDPLKNSEDIRITTSYVEYVEVLPLRNDAILYESFNGNSLTCNPLAIFRGIIEHPIYKSYLHVWALNDHERIPEEYHGLPNVIFLRKGSDGYLRHLATAKYLINNSGFPTYFVRRPGQKYLATWHGTPLKTLGKEQKYKFYDHKRTQRNFLQATHIISPNKHTSDIQLDSYDIRPLYTGMYAETGYPRIDLTLNASEANKAYIRQRMGLTADRPVVLYAPTWRGTLDDVAFDTERLENDLLALAELDCQIIFRGHSLLERVLDADEVACQVVPADIDTNELLSIVDVLITDYSSIFFDFLATGRPVLYYIYDVEEYEQERGLYFSMEDMPGIKCRTIEELHAGVAMAIRGEGMDAEHYHASQKLYNYRDDGNATWRVIEFFFENSTECALEYRKESKPAIIINAGSFQANGITTSAINLIKGVDRDAYDVVLAFSPNPIESSPEALVQFAKLPSDIYAVPRHGNMPMTLEERWVRRCQEAGAMLSGSEARGILENAYAREFCRIMGDKKYDAAISFSGYDAFWSSIFFINKFALKKLVYLHNDMYSEYVLKYPELARMFDIYQYADSLVSVSEQTNQLNKSNLAIWPGIDAAQFVHCDNVINAEEITEQSLCEFEQPEDQQLFNGSGKVFVNIGRLSMEKDQQKLIHAFAAIGEKYPDAKLLILGDGPLRTDLEALVEEMQLDGRVHILGYRRNPYNYLQAADCFVLSSIHEGQPMTLLESLVLGKPVIATDIVGNRSVMQGRGGLLVENSVAGLVQGMEEFISGAVPVVPFDWYSYNKAAVAQFYQCVMGADWVAKNSAADSGSLRGFDPSTVTVNFFNKATSANYLEVQQQLNGLVIEALEASGCKISETGRSYVEDAVNFTWFIRQKADVLMSHGVADKNYYWMMDTETGERYLDHFKAVCVPGRWMKERIVRSKRLQFGEDQVHVVGWPRLDLLRRQQALIETPATKDVIHLLWAPTHDNRKRGPEQKSTSSYPDFEPYAQKLAESYTVEYALHPHNRKDKTPTLDKMLRANVVVSDFGTMVYEAWALGKPVIFPIWILQDRIQKYLPGSAEAYIFENKIGYHPESYEEMLEILAAGPVITPDVDIFMDEYLDNYRSGLSAPKIAEVLLKVA